MTRREGLGKRKTPRVDFVRPGFLILEPDGPWVECFVIDVSDGGAGLRVGSLALPDIFVLLLTPGGKVRRLCKLKWRRGELAGVSFISAKELVPAKIPEKCGPETSEQGGLVSDVHGGMTRGTTGHVTVAPNDPASNTHATPAPALPKGSAN